MSREKARVRNGAQDGEAVCVRASFRSTWLGWTDPYTGEQLTVRMDGGTDFVSELVSEGFELLTSRDSAEEEARERENETAQGVRRFVSPAVAAEVQRAGNRRVG